jgi:hypothetical protein
MRSASRQPGDVVKIPDKIKRYAVISADSPAGAQLYEYNECLKQLARGEFDAWAATYVDP